MPTPSAQFVVQISRIDSRLGALAEVAFNGAKVATGSNANGEGTSDYLTASISTSYDSIPVAIAQYIVENGADDIELDVRIWIELVLK